MYTCTVYMFMIIYLLLDGQTAERLGLYVQYEMMITSYYRSRILIVGQPCTAMQGAHYVNYNAPKYVSVWA